MGKFIIIFYHIHITEKQTYNERNTSLVNVIHILENMYISVTAQLDL